MEEIKDEIDEVLTSRVVTKRAMLSLIGKLNFCTRVIRKGHMFVRRLIHSTKKCRNLHHRIKIDNMIRSDLMWWKKCICSHNGKTWFPRGLDVETAVLIFTDASDIALAGLCGYSWTFLEFAGEKEWMRWKGIAWKELLAVVITIATFGNRLRNRQVVLRIDNMAMCCAIQSGKSPVCDIMGLLRALYFYTEVYNIDYHSIFIDTVSNECADAISRKDMFRFFSAMPMADKFMTKPMDVIMDF